MNYLIIVAHPDDEVLGCGGTIAKLAKEGHDVFVAILGEGITSRFNDRAKTDINSLQMLHKQSRQVAEFLGVKEIFMYSLPDNRFDSVPLLDIIKKIENLILKIKPDVIFTHYAGDLNIDHCITHRAVLTATRPIHGNTVKDIYSFEIPSSTEWAFGQFSDNFNPNVFVDIAESVDVKLKAMEMYEGEARKFPHPRSERALKNLAECRGAAVGLHAAEAFELVRKIIRQD